MERTEIEKIAREETKTFLKISRVPTPIRDLFVEIAEGEFCGDYGMLLREILLSYLEYQRVKSVLLDKEFMTHILENKQPVEVQVEKDETQPKRITFADMNRMKGGVNK